MNNIIDRYNPIENSVINDSVINDSVINRHVDKIYVINLNTDKLRAKYIEILMKKLNINYELIRVQKPTQKIYNRVIE